ncbi:MAG: polyprenyl synthetase family protein [Planctomycetota bacterium]|jgi:geranylgeranyl diphosphate synthase type II
MDRLIKYMKEQGAVVDEALENALPRRKAEPETLHEAMRYSIFAGGKRLRPVLCLMTAGIFDCPGETALPAACSLEMIHTYSLIHDDLPAMDDDDYRRGKLSCHKAFGEAMAILAGDALLTLAFESVAQSPSATAGELAKTLAVASGHAGMVGGQVMDLEAENREGEDERSEEEKLTAVKAIHRRKTGALITAAVEMGAILGGADKEARDKLIQYGQRIGLAFQIKDDILDREAPQEKLGKTVGKDEASGKLTYPAVLGMDGAKKLLRDTVLDAKELLCDFGEKALMLRLLADFIAERDH